MNLKVKKIRGFTLVETLIAISILSIVVVGVFTAVQNGLQDSSISKDQITAFYLAQEGMEFIKNIRDENALNNISVPGSRNWLTGLASQASDPCYFGKTCRIDSPAKTIVACSGGFGSCPVLNQDSSTGLFGYTSGGTWVATTFKRDIQFTQVNADEVIVTEQMTWTSFGQTKTFQVYESFFNR